MHDDFGERLKRDRERYGLSRAQLAAECRVTERTIQRIESGQTKNPREHARRELGNALEKLTKAQLLDDAEGAPPPVEVSETAKVGGQFLPELRLAFDLVHRRYGWSEKRLIALTPLMFVLLVERCILWQEQRLTDLQDRLACLDEQLSRRLSSAIRQDQTLNPVDVDTQCGLPERFHETFGEFLSMLAADIPNGLADPMVTDRWSGSQGRVCDNDLQRITGGSNEAQWALVYGDVTLDDIPRELMTDEATPGRGVWLEDRLSAEVKSMLRERHKNGLPVSPMSTQRQRTEAKPPLD